MKHRLRGGLRGEVGLEVVESISLDGKPGLLLILREGLNNIQVFLHYSDAADLLLAIRGLLPEQIEINLNA